MAAYARRSRRNKKTSRCDCREKTREDQRLPNGVGFTGVANYSLEAHPALVWPAVLQKERKLQELEGLAEKYNISLHLCNVSHVTLEKSNSFQLLQNISVGASEILACLERAIASQTSLQERYRDLLGLVSVSWKFYNGSFYFFSQEKKPWQEAEQACLSHGAHLTSVTSVKEMAFLHLQAKRDFFWIGLTDQREEGNWTWTDGTKYNHEVSFWREGEPNNLDSAPEKREDCVHFISDRSLPLWNDMRCGAEFRWICKKVFS